MDLLPVESYPSGFNAALGSLAASIGLSSSAAHHEPLLHFRGAYRQPQARAHYPRPRPLPIALEELT